MEEQPLLPPMLVAEAKALLEAARKSGLRTVTAESCTGGLVAAAMTGIAGSSSMVERGFVTYSNEAKTELLDVPASLIQTHGAVSEQVARAMAEGALAHSAADVSVAITGIAGPTGGSPDKRVGRVHIAAARRDGTTLHEMHQFPGDRDAVRLAAAVTALRLLRIRMGE